MTSMLTSYSQGKDCSRVMISMTFFVNRKDCSQVMVPECLSIEKTYGFKDFIYEGYAGLSGVGSGVLINCTKVQLSTPMARLGGILSSIYLYSLADSSITEGSFIHFWARLRFRAGYEVNLWIPRGFIASHCFGVCKMEHMPLYANGKLSVWSSYFCDICTFNCSRDTMSSSVPTRFFSNSADILQFGDFTNHDAFELVINRDIQVPQNVL
ncbi:hypothetical protein MKW98_007662 [Papaver atlanticum]|uniref:Uncharacterized protein n=1 Tax=Papaver atlanticum TaxID=357466 RepID=A0AAD4S4M2_9MAGN|nr:hypothetical protein MKW98_007662 [Papaver atlanticum]